MAVVCRIAVIQAAVLCCDVLVSGASGVSVKVVVVEEKAWWCLDLSPLAWIYRILEVPKGQAERRNTRRDW